LSLPRREQGAMLATLPCSFGMRQAA